MRKLLLYGLIACLASACAVSPTGRQQMLLMNTQQINAMGGQAFNELKSKKPIETNPQVNTVVQCVAYAVTAGLPGDAQGRWEVVVFRDPSPNAFALPGGKIGVHTGIFKVARNPDQLAAVIAHEVGHVMANHSNERISQQYATQGGLLAVDVAVGAFYGSSISPEARKGLIKALGIGAQYGLLMPFSRTQESEADRIGLDLMARAGFDPRQSITLWRNMQAAGGGEPIEFLSTHPSSDTRIRELEAALAQAMPLYQAAQAQGRRPNCG